MRAETVGKYLTNHGIEAQVGTAYPVMHQFQIERENGKSALRKTMITPRVENPQIEGQES